MPINPQVLTDALDKTIVALEELRSALAADAGPPQPGDTPIVDGPRWRVPPTGARRVPGGWDLDGDGAPDAPIHPDVEHLPVGTIREPEAEFGSASHPWFSGATEVLSGTWDWVEADRADAGVPPLGSVLVEGGWNRHGEPTGNATDPLDQRLSHLPVGTVAGPGGFDTDGGGAPDVPFPHFPTRGEFWSTAWGPRAWTLPEA